MDMNRLEYLKATNDFIRNHKSCFQDILTKLNWKEDKLFTVHNGSSQDDLQENTKDFKSSDELSTGGSESKTHSDGMYSELLASLPQSVPEEKEKSWLEKLAEERDMKRRRINYKQKVHTKNKSSIEILREVIQIQMGTLGEPAPSDESLKSRERNTESSQLLELDPHLVAHVGPKNPHKLWTKVSDIVSLQDQNRRREPEPERRLSKDEHRSTYRRRDDRYGYDAFDSSRKSSRKDAHSDRDDKPRSSKRSHRDPEERRTSSERSKHHKHKKSKKRKHSDRDSDRKHKRSKRDKDH